MPGNLFQISGLGSGVDTASMLDALRQYRMRPVQLEQKRQDGYAAKQRAWQDINTRLLAVKTAADALTQTAAFSSVKAATGDTSVATATAGASAAPGAVNLAVTQLAQARKLASNTFADGSAALGLSGDFTINGKTVRVTAEDSLSSLATKINTLGAGASASVIQIAAGQYRLTLSGQTTGLQDSLSLANVQGGTSLTTLGLLDGSAAAVRHSTVGPSGTSATGSGFAASTTALGTEMALRTNFLGSFTVNGGTVSYDTAIDTLSTLADKINGLSISGLSARVATVADANGKSTQRLQITGASGAPSFDGDANGLLPMIGVTQGGTASANVLSSARDSQFTLDGLTLQRAGNTVSDALTGVTLNLLKEGAGATTTLTLSRDTQAAVDAVGKFVSAYNDAKGKIKSQSTYVPGTDASATPALFGDATLQRIGDDLASTLSRSATGLPAGFQSLRDIGIKLETSGTLSVDNAALAAAVQKDPDSVAKLFGTFSQASDTAARFVSAGTATKEGTYAVETTTAAEQARITAGSAPGARSTNETLRFSGTLFPAEKTVTLAPADTLAQVIAKINGSEVGKQVTAFDDGGRLGLRSNSYGSAQSFSVVSDLALGGTGIGTVARSDAGVDVAGTIGGETAGGSGQTLTGNQAGGAANGLAIKVTATAAGSYGTVSAQRRGRLGPYAWSVSLPTRRAHPPARSAGPGYAHAADQRLQGDGDRGDGPCGRLHCPHAGAVHADGVADIALPGAECAVIAAGGRFVGPEQQEIRESSHGNTQPLSAVSYRAGDGGSRPPDPAVLRRRIWFRAGARGDGGQGAMTCKARLSANAGADRRA